jgi:hypothetical protein
VFVSDETLSKYTQHLHERQKWMRNFDPIIDFLVPFCLSWLTGNLSHLLDAQRHSRLFFLLFSFLAAAMT